MADSTGSALTIFLQEHLRPDMTVLDIGTNVADITAIAAEVVGHDGRVIAYEPGRDAFGSLQNRFSQHPQVQVRHTAVSDRPGVAEFFVDLSKSTSSTLFSRVAEPSYERCRVRVLRWMPSCRRFHPSI